MKDFFKSYWWLMGVSFWLVWIVNIIRFLIIYPFILGNWINKQYDKLP